jgi:hypothetical protein
MKYRYRLWGDHLCDMVGWVGKVPMNRFPETVEVGRENELKTTRYIENSQLIEENL